MNLKGLVAVSGKPGLYKIIGQNKTGFILESLDDQKSKLIVNLTTAKLASLEDITVFGDSDDIKLVDIFERMKHSSSIPEPKTDGQVLRSFFREVAPEHDEDRVYASDMKKIISWFNLIKDLPLFTENAASDESQTDSEPVEAVEASSAESKPKTAKKASKKPKKTD